MQVLNSWTNRAGQVVVETNTGLQVLPRHMTVAAWQAGQERRERGRAAAQAAQTQVAAVERELAKPGNERLVASVNTETGAVTVFAVPTPVGGGPDDTPAPGAVLSPARRHELEVQRDLLRAIADDKQSSPTARTKAKLEADKIDTLLRLPNQPA